MTACSGGAWLGPAWWVLRPTRNWGCLWLAGLWCRSVWVRTMLTFGFLNTGFGCGHAVLYFIKSPVWLQSSASKPSTAVLLTVSCESPWRCLCVESRYGSAVLRCCRPPGAHHREEACFLKQSQKAALSPVGDVASFLFLFFPPT